jgi:ABC-type lipoprotein export system ATPase subunit
LPGLDVFAALRQVVGERQAACLVATHDPEALRFADQILSLVDGELTEVTGWCRRPSPGRGPAVAS